ncbi:hypothetical protein [Neobacillus drentensis]|uniref:hypothetical protein n=1 Tax=Neobacillus drentensis TaxID=220684 RepID=UPI0030021031
MTDTNKMRDVYVTVADPTRRERIRLLADVEELPLHVRLNRYKVYEYSNKAIIVTERNGEIENVHS